MRVCIKDLKRGSFNKTQLPKLKELRISTFFTPHFPCRNGTIGILNTVTPRNGTRRAFFLSAAWLAVDGNIFVGTRVWVIMYPLLSSLPRPDLGGADTARALHRAIR